MTEQELNALVASLASLEGAASSGPWTYSEKLRIIEGPFGVPIAIGIASETDGHLIATARNALVTLLGALQAARMECAAAAVRADRLQEQVARLTEAGEH